MLALLGDILESPTFFPDYGGVFGSENKYDVVFETHSFTNSIRYVVEAISLETKD